MKVAVNRSVNRVIHFPFARMATYRKVKWAKDIFLPLSHSRSRWRVASCAAWLGWAPLSSILLHFPVPRNERMLEHVIRHAPTLGNTLGLVKRPMDTEIDTALAVLFLSLRER